MDKVETFYLEMHSPESHQRKVCSSKLYICEAEEKQFQFNRFLYQFVGEAWQWTDKLTWTDKQWQTYAEADNLRTWVGYINGSPAGYFELQKQSEGNVEIAYFGLANRFIGKGYGGVLLSHAITSAWEWGNTKRIWVHTCSLDHPGALHNYQARGMAVYKVEAHD